MNSNSVATGNHSNRPPAASLQLLEQRLARLEEGLAPLMMLGQTAPAAIATVGDIADDWSRRIGDVDQRLFALAKLAEILTQPQTLDNIGHAVKYLEAVPKLVAMMGDVGDEIMSDATANGVDLTHLISDARKLLIAGLQLATSSRLRSLLAAGTIQTALRTAGDAAQAIADVHHDPPQALGLFGAMRATREPNTQHALGFALGVVSRFGNILTRKIGRRGGPRLLG